MTEEPITTSKNLSRDDIERLYKNSRSLGALGVFASISIVFQIIALIGNGGGSGSGIVIAMVITATLATICAFGRPEWGRTLGIMTCIPILIAFPIGTLLGALGIIAYSKSPELFGENRVTHKELSRLKKESNI